MNYILEKLGQDPKLSMKRFIQGIGLFVIGVLFIFLGYYQHHLWQVLGIIFLSLGSIVAAWGYIGLFANRLYHIFNRHK